MNVHKHVRIIPAGRALLVERLLVGERAEDVACEMGVSRRTAFKCTKRYREEGDAGLEDRSRTVDGAGWAFLHVCVDDGTRVAYAEVGPDEKRATAAGIL